MDRALASGANDVGSIPTGGTILMGSLSAGRQGFLTRARRLLLVLFMISLIIAWGIFIFLMVILFTYAYGGIKAAPRVPMRSRDLSRLDRLMPIRSHDVVYDLGCGDAKILTHALDQGAQKAVGYEVSLMPYIFARLRGIKYGKKLHIRYRDFWKENVSDATVIFLFLSYNAHAKLGKKFMEELKPGTRIATYVWPIEGWTPQMVDKTKKDLSIYIYER